MLQGATIQTIQLYLAPLIVNTHTCETSAHCVKSSDRNYGPFIEVKVYVSGLIS